MLKVLVGLPGSGKTTYAKNCISKSVDVIIIDGDSITDRDYSKKDSLDKIIEEIKKVHNNKNKVIVDGLFITKASQQLFIDNFIETVIEFIFLDTDKNLCIERDNIRCLEDRHYSSKKFIERNYVHNPYIFNSGLVVTSILKTSFMTEVMKEFGEKYYDNEMVFTSDKRVLAGSTYGSCWDDGCDLENSTTICDDDESILYEVYELESLLKKLYSSFSIEMDNDIYYKYISELGEIDSCDESDYYGGVEYYEEMTIRVIDIFKKFFKDELNMDNVSLKTINDIYPEVFI